MQSSAAFPIDLRRSFDRQLKLCDDLEAVADSLPSRADRQFCLHLARQIGPVLRDAHAIEERLLFPRIDKDNSTEIIDRLRWEHLQDVCYGEEVQHELLQLGKGLPIISPEALGYMLRGFFEGMRRHAFHEMGLIQGTPTTH
jgi:hypothetical protein